MTHSDRSRELTGKQLLERIGIKSARTLWRWQRHGLIPVPEVKPAPGGRGRTAYWDDTVVDRCFRILELQRLGHSLKEVKAALEHTAIQQRTLPPQPRRSKRRRPPVRIRPKDRFTGTLFALTSDLLTDEDLLRALLGQVERLRVFEQARKLVQRKLTPVMVFDGVDAMVIPHTALTEYFENPGPRVQARHRVLVIPLYLPLTDSYVGVELPSAVQQFVLGWDSKDVTQATRKRKSRRPPSPQ